MNEQLSTSNIAEQMSARIAELEHRLATDGLTGARSRDYFLDNFKQFADASGTLYFLDIDNFKSVNDYYGHAAGDTLLRRIARELRAVLSGDDFVARLGGDEFVVLTKWANQKNTVGLGQTLLDVFGRAQLEIGELTVSRGASIGCLRLSPDMGTHEAIDLGDTAMRCAKTLGKNRVHCLNDVENNQPFLRPSVDELRLALQRSEIDYYLQPIVSCTDRSVVGYEALLRWERANGQILAPAQFLATMTEAYSSDARPPLEFARQATEWATIDRGAFCCFNISMAFLEKIASGNDDWVKEIIGASPRDRIVFEITEAAITSRTERVVNTVNRLRESGIRIALDDFGVGASNLERLHSIQVDLIKIDQRFVRGAPRNRKGRDILAGMIDLARKIGARTVIEGIEEPEQFQLAQALGADMAQGFHLGQPLPYQRH